MLYNLIRAARAMISRGLTLTQIVKNAGPERRRLAAFVRVRQLKVGVSRKLRVPKAIARTFSVEHDGLKKSLVQYSTFIEFHPKEKVKVSCSCEDFLYRWEYALFTRDASYITYSNGEIARETNPKNIGGACKHVLALRLALIEQKSIPTD